MDNKDKEAGLPIRNAVLIAGPTASGKSRAALTLARRIGGTVVNADSMQVYSVLEVLTARPGADELAAVPHALYGHVHPAEPYSVGRWAREVADLAAAGAFADRPPVFVGGTGLYFRALCEGLSTMPEIPDPIRRRWRYRLAEEGASRLYRVLMLEDPEAAAVLRPSDGQRIVRALEVMDASGRSIIDWQSSSGRPLIDMASARRFVVDPDHRELNERIDERFDAMIGGAAPAEVAALLALDLPSDAPAMKAIGVREIAAANAGEITLAAAAERAKAATRRYAKRQATWFRNQLDAQWTRPSSAAALIDRFTCA